MHPPIRTGLLSLMLALALSLAPACAQQGPQAAPAAESRDGQRDFDFEFGSWRTHVRRLRNPLSGSTDWVDYEGTSVVHPLLGGRANLVELSIAGAAGRIEGVSLRLYNPETKRWSLHYAGIASGALTAPVVGAFESGRGEFFGEDTLNGRPIRVRFVISDIDAHSARFEQAFSADGGRTWEVNWIATDTRR